MMVAAGGDGGSCIVVISRGYSRFSKREKANGKDCGERNEKEKRTILFEGEKKS